MAKIKFSISLVTECLFPGCNVEIQGIEFDPMEDIVILKISGPEVPGVENVILTVKQEHRKYIFTPI